MRAERPTADDVRALRDSPDSPGGMQTCWAFLLREYRRARLAELRLRVGELYTVESCHSAIVEIVEFLQEVDRDSGRS